MKVFAGQGPSGGIFGTVGIGAGRGPFFKHGDPVTEPFSRGWRRHGCCRNVVMSLMSLVFLAFTDISRLPLGHDFTKLF